MWRKKAMAVCPACEAELDLDENEAEEGSVISCIDCGADFEIVTPRPLELKLVGADDDDEDDDEDADEEEDLEDEDDDEVDDYDEDDDDDA